MEIRKIMTVVEETRLEGVKKVEKPVHKAAAIAVIKNPFAGKYQEDLAELADAGERLGKMLGEKVVSALGISPDEIDSFGCGAIVGAKGELEHAAAILYPKFEKPFKDVVKGGKAFIPSSEKRGGVGSGIDIPLGFKNAAFVRTHYDAMEVRIGDAPQDDEILVAVVVTDAGRPLARIVGLRKDEIKGEDGLR